MDRPAAPASPARLDTGQILPRLMREQLRLSIRCAASFLILLLGLHPTKSPNTFFAEGGILVPANAFAKRQTAFRASPGLREPTNPLVYPRYAANKRVGFQLHQSLGNRQTKTSPTVATRARAIGLGKGLKDCMLFLGKDCLSVTSLRSAAVALKGLAGK